MKNRLALSLLAAVAGLGAQSVTPPVPAELQVPAGNAAFLNAQAVGTQNYMCVQTPAGFSWSFYGPDATLFVTLKWFTGDIKRQVVTHFLSPNPVEEGTARATWQSSFDSSRVWGRQKAASSDPSFVAPGAIPWLLLEVAGTQNGPTEGGTLSQTTFIQRVNTSGGVAPATGCSMPEHIGAKALVHYTTDYVFYRANRDR